MYAHMLDNVTAIRAVSFYDHLSLSDSISMRFFWFILRLELCTDVNR